jgi:hypothetical protein
LEKAILGNKPYPLPETVSPFMRDVVDKLLDKDFFTRPDPTKLLSLPEIKEAAQRLHNQIREVDPEMAQKMFEEP